MIECYFESSKELRTHHIFFTLMFYLQKWVLIAPLVFSNSSLLYVLISLSLHSTLLLSCWFVSIISSFVFHSLYLVTNSFYLCLMNSHDEKWCLCFLHYHKVLYPQCDSFGVDCQIMFFFYLALIFFPSIIFHLLFWGPIEQTYIFFCFHVLF